MHGFAMRHKRRASSARSWTRLSGRLLRPARRAAFAALLTAIAVLAVLVVTDRAGATAFFAGSTTLSVDHSSAAGGTGAYATIQSILFFEGAADDFAPGRVHTLILLVPAGFEFEAGSGSLEIAPGGDITAGNLDAVTPTAITLSFTTDAGGDGSDSITVSGVRARPTTTTPATGQIQASAASTAAIVGLVRQGEPGTVTNFGILKTVAGLPTGSLVVEPLNTDATNGSGGPAAALNAGVTFAVRVRALDRFGNNATIGAQSTPATIAFTTNAGPSPDGTAPTLPATAMRTFTGGRAEVAGFVLPNAATGQTLTAAVQAAGTTSLGSTSAGASAGLTVNAGAVSAVTITTQPGGATAGGPLAPQPVVAVVDAFANPISTAATGVQVTAGVADGGAPLQGTTTIAIDATGLAAYTDLQLNAAGHHTLTFTAGPMSVSSAAFDVVAGPGNALVVQTLDTNTAGGSPTAALRAGTPFAVRVSVTDQFLNPALDVDGNVALAFTTNAGSAPNGAAPTAGVLSAAIAFTDGVAAVTGFMLTNAAAGQTITATVQNAGAGTNFPAPVNGVTGTSDGATVRADAPVAFAVAALDANAAGGSPTTALTAGTPFAVRVSVTDQFLNPVPGIDGDVTLDFTTNAGAAPDGTTPTVDTRSGTVSVADGVGVATGFVLTSAGAGQTITAAVAGGDVAALASGTTATSPAASVAAGAPVALTLATLDGNATDGSASPTTSLTAGSPFAVRIIAFDRFDNRATQVSGPVGLAFTTNAGAAPDGTPATVTSRSGAHAFASGVAEVGGFVLTHAGAAQTITAAVANAGIGGNLAQPANGLSTTSAPATVQAGPPRLVLRTIDPGTGSEATIFLAGTAFTVRVLVADAFENATAGVNGNVDLAFTTSGGAAAAVASRSGVYTFAAASADVTGFVLPDAATGLAISAVVRNAGAGGNLATPADGVAGSTVSLTIEKGDKGDRGDRDDKGDKGDKDEEDDKDDKGDKDDRGDKGEKADKDDEDDRGDKDDRDDKPDRDRKVDEIARAAEKPDKPAGKADKPARNAADQPADKPDTRKPDKPAGKADKPAQNAADKNAADKPAQHAADQPAEQADRPAEKAADQPAEKPDKPAEKPDQPAEKVDKAEQADRTGETADRPREKADRPDRPDKGGRADNGDSSDRAERVDKGDGREKNGR